MNLSEKDLDNFIAWIAKQEALDIFGADHEIISTDMNILGMMMMIVFMKSN